MIWLGTMVLATCFFLPPKTPVVGLPETDPHEFLERKETCTCCHEAGRDGRPAPHDFTVDISESCMRCHGGESIGLSHPLGEDADLATLGDELSEELPMSDGVGITCGTCHNPHLPGYVRERYASRQEPAGVRLEDRMEVAYYKSYRLRLHAPDAGNDPTCAACHVKYF